MSGDAGCRQNGQRRDLKNRRCGRSAGRNPQCLPGSRSGGGRHRMEHMVSLHLHRAGYGLRGLISRPRSRGHIREFGLGRLSGAGRQIAGLRVPATLPGIAAGLRCPSGGPGGRLATAVIRRRHRGILSASAGISCGKTDTGGHDADAQYRCQRADSAHVTHVICRRKASASRERAFGLACAIGAHL